MGHRPSTDPEHGAALRPPGLYLFTWLQPVSAFSFLQKSTGRDGKEVGPHLQSSFRPWEMSWSASAHAALLPAYKRCKQGETKLNPGACGLRPPGLAV